MYTVSTFLISILLPFLVFSSACNPDSDFLESQAQTIDSRPFFDLFEGEDKKNYFSLMSSNHETVLSSQGYSSRTAALHGILSVLDNAEKESNFKLRLAIDGRAYFILTARNGKTIGRSALYINQAHAQEGISRVYDMVGDYLAFLATRQGPRFTITEADTGQYYFTLRARNDLVVLQSQAYSSEAAAMNGTFAVLDASVKESNYIFHTSKDGSITFHLRAVNHEIIGTSNEYSSKSKAKKASQEITQILANLNIL